MVMWEQRKKRAHNIRQGQGFQKRRQEYIEELHKKGLNDLEYHNDVVTHLELNILDYEVKWALGSIIMNKASGVDGIPVELFKVLIDDAVKVGQ